MIGGFFPLEFPNSPEAFTNTKSVYDFWTKEALQVLKRRNARSVVAALLKAHNCRRLWLPAYCCHALQSLEQIVQVQTYPMERDLSPCLAGLEGELARGDALLGINYFGSPAAAEYAELHAGHADVLFIEDCAQDLLPGAHWGDWRIFSPRKLLGVPDGGLGVCFSDDWIVPNPVLATHFSKQVASDMLPSLFRFEDLTGEHNEEWYSLYQEVEAGHCVEGLNGEPARGMGRLSEYILSHFSIDYLAERRISNQMEYYSRLPKGITLYPSVFEKPMLGVPVVLKRRDEINTELSRKGIFCARHWESLPTSSCAESLNLSKQILTLPSDHRYNVSDVDCVVNSLLGLL
ncbi:hypothetical protein [uncultured Pseudodesulfovibrio sp.]|uniref:hypothetical protein n=1 Tax=uncultured Pseudodesulfovibrio sp. TaxID=2035858 RepID=UPI00374977FC